MNSYSKYGKLIPMLFYLKSLLILLFLITFNTSFLGSPSTQVELASITTQIEKNEKQIEKKEKVKKKVQANLNVINRDLRFTEQKLSRAKKNLTYTKQKIINTRKRIKTLRHDYEISLDKFKKRLVKIYKNKDAGWLGFIFMPSKFNELEESPYYFEKLLQVDLSLIENVQKTHHALNNEKKRLNQQKNRFSKLKQHIAQQEKKLSVKKTSHTKQIHSLKTQIAKIIKQNRELQESSRQIEATIRELAVKNKGFFGTGRLLKPVKGWISSKFGMRKHPIFKRYLAHNGIDFAAPKGYRIRAADSGRVIVAGTHKRYKGYGKVTVIDHGQRHRDGKRISTLYAHQSRILVKKGSYIKKGDEIGWVGSSGYATGPHLHFELRVDGKPQDPLRFINKSYL